MARREVPSATLCRMPVARQMAEDVVLRWCFNPLEVTPRLNLSPLCWCSVMIAKNVLPIEEGLNLYRLDIEAE